MLGEIRGEVRFKEPLSFHTSLRIGGPADIFVVPQDTDDIRHALMFAEREQLPVSVIGGGNNMLVKDRGVRGVILRLEGCLGRAEFHGEEAIAGAGVSLSALIREAAAINLGGIECLVGIPATIGGALAMNAGTADGWIGDFVSAVYYLHPDGTLGEYKPSSGTFTYRNFNAPAGAVLIGCRLRLHRKPLAEIQKEMKARLKVKKSTQPLALASAGCVWKNPAGDVAARMIEKSGLKGKRINGAEMPSGLSSPRSRASVLADMGERSAFVARQRVGRSKRPRPGRRARLRRLVGVALTIMAVAVVGGAALHWLLTTQRFAVASVEVRGVSRVPPDQILAVAAIPPGTNIFRLDTMGVTGRVEALPEVRRADVVRELPDRVVISVEERRPFTLVHGGRLHWMDEEGRLLGAPAEAVTSPLPVISGLSADELASMRTAPGPRARAAIALIRAIARSGSELTAEISEIDMSRREGPVLYTVDGVEVRLGSEDWEERLARLEGVLAQVATQDVRAVDLRFRDQVVFRRGEAR